MTMITITRVVIDNDGNDDQNEEKEEWGGGETDEAAAKEMRRSLCGCGTTLREGSCGASGGSGARSTRDRGSVRELVEEHVIRVPFVATADNVADFFTKALDAKSFFRFRNIIMNVPT